MQKKTWEALEDRAEQKLFVVRKEQSNRENAKRLIGFCEYIRVN